MLSLGQANNNPPWTVLNLHTDHLGTVRMITNVLGGLVSRHDYFPFGQEITSSQSYNTHQYTGHERDKETGLDYMLARYYEPAVGRFLSADPSRRGIDKMNPHTWNLYSYSLDNPVTLRDPSGKTPTISYAPNVTPGTVAAAEKYINTPSVQAIPKSVSLSIENSATIMAGGRSTTGLTSLDIGYSKGGDLVLHPTAGSPDGKTGNATAVQKVVGHEFGHLVDASKNPGAVLESGTQNVEDRRQSEAEGEKAVMDIAVAADEEAAEDEQKMNIHQNEPHIVAGKEK
jgi:RHS repeat-associated protein